MYTSDVIEKAGFARDILDSELEIKAEKVDNAGWVISFEAVSQAPPQHPPPPELSTFQINLDLTSV